MRLIVGCIVVGMLALAGCGQDKRSRAANAAGLRKQKKAKAASREEKTVVVPRRTEERAAEPADKQPKPVTPSDDKDSGSRNAVRQGEEK